MASKGTLTVRIIGDDRSFNGAMGRMQRGMGSILGPIGKVGAAFGGMALAAGAALVGIGNEFDKVQDTIRIGTGATGDALDGLMEDFRAVARDVPATFGDISTAIADLNTRLGLTGEPLQEVATQVLNLARLTGSDLAATIPAVTRLMKDWGVEADDIASSLDDVFVASQATGIGVDALAQQAVQFGSPLRQLGFSFSEVLALFGSFEQQGVNVETVMSGLRQSIGRFAREGEAPAQALRRVIEEIQGLDSAAANARAIEAFGARAGPDLAAAIQEGRFEFDELVKTIEGSEESIEKATEDTDSFAAAWQTFKNNVLLALEEPATQVFGRLEELMEGLVPVIQRVARAFEEEGLNGAMAVLAEEWAKAMPKIQAWFDGTFKPWWDNTAVPWMEYIGGAMGTALANGLVDVLAAVLPKAVEGIINGLNFMVETFINGINSAIEDVLFLGGVDFGDVDFGNVSLPSIPVPDISNPVPRPESGITYNPDRHEVGGGRTASSATGATVINVYNPTPQAAEQDISREMRLRYP